MRAFKFHDVGLGVKTLATALPNPEGGMAILGCVVDPLLSVPDAIWRDLDVDGQNGQGFCRNWLFRRWNW